MAEKPKSRAQRAKRVITLMTDFGSKDWFVGTMKGVILGIEPRASIVDITHDILSGDIRAGAFALAASYRFFPKGTVHVAVVDPGVGSERKAVAVQTASYFFVGPNNGVLSLALRGEKIRAICALENERYFLQPLSRTFHGRDVFSPVAAHLSRGLLIQKLGPPLERIVTLPWPEPRQHGQSIGGEVIYIDRFGNGITNISGDSLAGFRQGSCETKGERRQIPIGSCYQSVQTGQPVGVIGSSGFLEIAVNGGSAAETLNLKIGTRVLVYRRRVGQSSSNS